MNKTLASPRSKRTRAEVAHVIKNIPLDAAYDYTARYWWLLPARFWKGIDRDTHGHFTYWDIDRLDLGKVERVRPIYSFCRLPRWCCWRRRAHYATRALRYKYRPAKYDYAHTVLRKIQPASRPHHWWRPLFRGDDIYFHARMLDGLTIGQSAMICYWR